MGGTVQGAPLPLASKDRTTTTVSTIAGSPAILGIADGVGTAARFGIVNGITTDGVNLYMTDYSNQTIRKYSFSDRSITTIAGVPGVAGISDTNPLLGIAAGFYFPSGITTDGVKNSRTNLYVVDCYNNTIRKVSFSNNSTSVSVTTIAGSAGNFGSVDAAIGTAALFNRPTDITTDGKNLYVTDSSSLTIRKISMTYPYSVTTIAGAPGIGGWTDGVGKDARFQYPARITTDGSYLYVTDFIANTIRRIDPNGNMVTTIAGTPGVTGSADGVGAAATFSNVNGITSDGTNLYVTDSNNNTVRKLVRDPSTGKWAVTTIAGTAGVAGLADGSGAAAFFRFPVGITSDGTSLYVTDSNNYTIRKIK
ncbi:MAG TPA: hypothetical protein VF795_04835 [Desulfuromonadaceae bacterium]